MNDRRYGDHDRSYETQRQHAGSAAQKHSHDSERNPSRRHEDFGERFGGHQDSHSAQGQNGHPDAGPFRGIGPAGYKRSDERISDDLHAAFTDDSHLDASGITITVKEGEATLNGAVRSRECKRRAEDVADRVPGVRHVQNNLRIKPQNSHEPIGATER